MNLLSLFAIFTSNISPHSLNYYAQKEMCSQLTTEEQLVQIDYIITHFLSLMDCMLDEL